MSNYYSEHLNSNKLKKCYEVAPERVKQFLEAEISFVLDKIHNEETVLDLGCGYGRISIRLIEKTNRVVGIDISRENISFAKELYGNKSGLEFYVMDALKLGFPDNVFDITLCLQNGISAFGIEPKELLKESLRVTKEGGILLFSSYSEKFWEERLNWFQIQSDEELLGEIDYNKTKKGIIVCKDGFTAITFSGEDFQKLSKEFNLETKIYEVDNSIIFYEMKKL